MTRSKHTKRAYVIGTPDVELDIANDGDISLDSSRFPHVKATIACRVDPSILDMTDPRDPVRIRLVIDTDPAGGPTPRVQPFTPQAHRIPEQVGSRPRTRIRRGPRQGLPAPRR